MKQAILIFAKNPIYGEVKTRLAATAGHDLALSVYRQLLEHTVAITTHLPINKILFYSKYIDEQDVWDNSIYEKQVQTGNDLGEKMINAFLHAFNKEYDKVAIIGTDCPELDPAIIMNAFLYLDNHDVVIGPARDGGYYLLGMKKLHGDIFRNITWSTEKVLSETLAACNRSKLSVYLLPELSDIDTENDLNKIKERLPIKTAGT